MAGVAKIQVGCGYNTSGPIEHIAGVAETPVVL